MQTVFRWIYGLVFAAAGYQGFLAWREGGINAGLVAFWVSLIGLAVLAFFVEIVTKATHRTFRRIGL